MHVDITCYVSKPDACLSVSQNHASPGQGWVIQGAGQFFRRPDDHAVAFKWQRASAAVLGKSGCVLWFYTVRFIGRQQNERQLPSRSPGAIDSASGREKNTPRPE